MTTYRCEVYESFGRWELAYGCSTEAQTENPNKMSSVGKVKLPKMVRVGEKRRNGCKGVMFGIPITVSMKELVENLEWCGIAQ